MIQEIILDDQTTIRCGYDECEINDGVKPNTVLYSGVINNYHRESEEFDPICYVVINTSKVSQVDKPVMQNLRVSETAIDEVRCAEILEELDSELMRCGIDEAKKVDELRYEYLNRLTEIKDDVKRYNLGESIKHKISEWYAGT